MILKYRCRGNNWVFVESDEVVVSTVFVGDISNKYKDKTYSMDELQALGREIEVKIANETGALLPEYGASNYLVVTKRSKPEEFTNVEVVILTGSRGIQQVYVFCKQDSEAYLLNSNGKTVQKIA